ncbi:uncharacterized protein LOC110268258 [Arachis ipaensis]|uniref:uncharacterized protein LOC110268258 n=1 Tax=Arachis ipaensis TaxID=130454 RepID=UPI000A2B4123|nr:uncharacterized protein LOC110268258 [Arachis ipaensis]
MPNPCSPSLPPTHSLRSPLTLSLSLSPLTLSLSPLTVVAPHAPLTTLHIAALLTVAVPPSPSSLRRLTTVITPKSEKSVCHHNSPLTASPLTTPGRLCAHSSSPLIFIIASLRCAVTSRRLCAQLKAFFIREENS